MSTPSSTPSAPRTPTAAAGPSLATPTAWQHLRHVLSENPVTLLAAGLFVLFVLMALVGPWLVPFDPLASNSAMALQPPSGAHWFGTDEVGRDVLARVIWGARASLAAGVIAVGIAVGVGVPIGMIAGYVGGWLDALIGLKSTALKFGDQSIWWLALFFALALALIDAAVWLAGGGIIAHVGIAAAAMQAAWQLARFQPDNGARCLELFRSNRIFGLIITLGFLLDSLLT